jgi:hypothetical protein
MFTYGDMEIWGGPAGKGSCGVFRPQTTFAKGHGSFHLSVLIHHVSEQPDFGCTELEEQLGDVMLVREELRY